MSTAHSLLPDALVRCFALCLCALGLAGCGPTLMEVRTRLADTPACCDRLSALRYAPIAVGESRMVSIGSDDPAFGFDTGKSYVAAIALPRAAEPIRLFVESYMRSTLQSPTTGDTYFLAPRITVLDADYRPLRVVESRQARVRYVPVTEFAATGGLGWARLMHADFDPGEGARFVVIHTTDSLLSQTTTVPAPRATGGTAPIAHSPTGLLRVKLAAVAQLLDVVMMLEREPAYATFVGIPRGKAGEVTAAIPAEKRAQLVNFPWTEFMAKVRGLLSEIAIRNEYPELALRERLLEVLAEHPGTPIGVTWNGGIAVTANDYAHARRSHDSFRLDPARYERERPRDRRRDPVHPLNHFEPLLGW